MSSSLMVNEQEGLQEVRTAYFPTQPAPLRVLARLISWIFHPVFVPVMVIWFLVYVHPYLFAGFSAEQKFRTVMMAAISFTFFPLITILLLKGLKFIDSIYLHTQKERVIPFMACMIWYFWIAYVWNNFGKTRDVVDIPHNAVQFAFAAFFSTIIGLMLNIKMKVSLHAISMGVVVCFFVLMALSQDINYAVYLALVMVIAGLVCTSRFMVSDHTPGEVYIGLLAGIVSMLIGYQAEKILSV
ncbi:MAG: hypothetical protein NTW29_09560 [Bacteroidetes bacterium]|nr:hypothetical protein [Bacteroidota bacterium]